MNQDRVTGGDDRDRAAASLIREHAREVTGFIIEGKLAMMRGMMGNRMMGSRHDRGRHDDGLLVPPEPCGSQLSQMGRFSRSASKGLDNQRSRTAVRLDAGRRIACSCGRARVR